MSLPIHKSDDRSLMDVQTTWSSALNPLISNPAINGILLKSVVLASGANIINHKLGRKLQGWIPVRLRASATIYDTQDSNPRPELTLQLTASAGITVDLYVF